MASDGIGAAPIYKRDRARFPIARRRGILFRKSAEQNTQRRNTLSGHTRHHETEVTTCDEVIPRARIVIADDDEDVRNLYAAILGFEGYQVTLAANGAEALEQLSNGEFQLLVTDRQMPVVDGEALVLRLRSAGIGIPVVMISGSLIERPLPEAVAREVAITLPKPVRAAKVLAAILLMLHCAKPALAPAA